jgi:signal transduction histidine kinase
VELTVHAQQRQVVLAVRDTGVGSPAEDLPRVFERFFRGDKSRHRGSETRGTGLGLSICRAVVQAHGGEIFVESDPGRGTAFTVVLPVAGGGGGSETRESSAGGSTNGKMLTKPATREQVNWELLKSEASGPHSVSGGDR